MGDVKGSDRRPYQSPLRSAQAASTRAVVLAAAHELFIEQGYGATTIDQIAARAGVSKPTVFTAVGNKAAVLAAVRDVAIAGDDEPVAVADRPSSHQVMTERDAARAVRKLAAHIAAINSRYAAINEVMRGAAAAGEPALRQLWDTSEQQRLTAARLYTATLREKRPLVCSGDRAADILWVVMDPDNYHRLVDQRRWSKKAYEDWVAKTITVSLFGATAPTAVRRTSGSPAW